MNISEANAAATILNYAAGISSPGRGPVTAGEAAEAGAFLADRVRRALLAGPLPERVEAGILALAIREATR